jgi:hypothetical protein
MRQAIVTTYHGATNTRGSRISATAEAGRIYVSYDYGDEDQHHRAAKALAEKMEWFGTWVAGGLPGGHGNCYAMREFKSSAERIRFHNKRLVVIEG